MSIYLTQRRTKDKVNKYIVIGGDKSYGAKGYSKSSIKYRQEYIIHISLLAMLKVIFPLRTVKHTP
jgi:hypothetical protein